MKQRQEKIAAAWKINFSDALERLVQLYDAWDKKDKADAWRKKLEEGKKAGDKKPRS